MNHFKQHWRGDLPLWVSFWVNYFLLNIFLYLLIAVVLMGQMNGQYPAQADPAYIIRFYLILIGVQLIVVYPWQIIGLWRASDKYRKEKNKTLWPLLAQAVVIVGLIWVIAKFTSDWENYKNLYGLGFDEDYLLKKLNQDSD